MAKLTSEQLHEQLEQCYCTSAYYDLGVLYPFNITDGVKTFIEGADAMWFMGYLLDYIDNFRRNYMYVIKLTVKNNRGEVELTNDNDQTFKGKSILYTDCPDGEYKFYMYWKGQEKPVLIWYREY